MVPQYLKRGSVRFLSCTSDVKKNGNVCDTHFIKSSGFNVFFGTLAGIGYEQQPHMGNMPLSFLKSKEKINKRFINALSNSNVRVIAYLSSVTFDERLFSQAEVARMAARFEQPAWAFGLKHRRFACYNRSAWMDHIVEKAIYMIKELGAAGILFDNMHLLNPCICEDCCRKFKKEMKRDLFVTLDNIKGDNVLSDEKIHKANEKTELTSGRVVSISQDEIEYRKWRFNTALQFLKRFRKIVNNQLKKETVVLINGHAISPDSMCACINETSDSIYFEEGYTYAPNNNIYAFKIGSAIGQGERVPIVVTRVKDGIPTPSQLKIGLGEGIAFGGYFSPWGFYLHESKDLEKTVKEYNAFFQKFENILTAEQDIAKTAIVYSPSHEFLFEKGLKRAATNSTKAMVQLLSDLHIPFKIVITERVSSLEQILRYNVLFLPGMEVVSDNHFNLFRKYIANGGKIITTGRFGQYDENYKIRKRKITSKNIKIFADFPEKKYAVERSNALIGEFRYFKPILENAFIRTIKEMVGKNGLLITTAKHSTAFNLTRTREAILLHGVNYNCYMEVQQVYVRPDKNIQIRLKVKEPIKKVTLFSPDIKRWTKKIEYRQKDDYLNFVIPEIKHYIIVKAEKWLSIEEEG